MMMRRMAAAAVGVLLSLGLCGAAARAETRTVARCGAGFLEEVDGYRVLHVKGTPYEMGYQQGALLKDHVRELARYLFDVKAKDLAVEVFGFKVPVDAKRLIRAIGERQRLYAPTRFYEEMRGVADGAGMTFDDVLTANFIPELFHCSGFALSKSATADGNLLHGRVLDYGVDWRLQDHAVLTVAEPDGKVPFCNVTYAGFIGSVTGMNLKGISIGEMGGEGMGHWEGVPMALLVRLALEESNNLDEAVAVFRDRPRTCQYFYVVADGNRGTAVGLEASWNAFTLIKMGESEPRLPHAIKDSVVLSVGKRYEELARRVQAGLGTFNADTALHLMDCPVAMKSNLHNVLFEPKTTRLWVANATHEGAPAANQPYHAFCFKDLLTHTPDSAAPCLNIPQ